jgi:hypothetical protein
MTRRPFRRGAGASLAVTVAALAAVAAAAPASTAATPGAQGGAVGAPFNPVSVTFVSLQTGWALGAVTCGGGYWCPALLQTRDSGSHWSRRPLPVALVALGRQRGGLGSPGQWLNVRFADPSDGWIFGGTSAGPLIWSTHDGGATWRPVGLSRFAGAYNPVLDLEANGRTVYFAAVDKQNRVEVESSPVGSDSWRADPTPPLGMPAGGGQPQASFVVQGGREWLVEGNDRGVTGSAQLSQGGRWVPWTAPCAKVGNSYAVPAAADADHLVAVCQIGGFASSRSRSDPPGAALGSYWLYFSHDGGASFSAGPELPRGIYFGGVLASPVPGAVLLLRSGKAASLAATFDGGRHWSDVFGLGADEPFYLAFTSRSQGVGLLVGNDATEMIMTSDGGHHWSRVAFP